TCLASCAGPRPVRIERHAVYPPPGLAAEVPQPELRGPTIGDALLTIPDLRAALERCNGRLRDVRRWRMQAEKGGQGDKNSRITP
ncbi:MAG TPA: hypothetical protein VKA48_06965, partial [Gammaproteobacteria bacterium]|nr:hypothetical protein [Gammaproteobacteria bacterium]